MTLKDGGYGQFISQWIKWIYPVRPDPTELFHFMWFLLSFPQMGITMLILGSTPELHSPFTFKTP